MQGITRILNQDALKQAYIELKAPTSPIATYIKRDVRTGKRVVSTSDGSSYQVNYISNSTPGVTVVLSDKSYIDQKPA